MNYDTASESIRCSPYAKEARRLRLRGFPFAMEVGVFSFSGEMEAEAEKGFGEKEKEKEKERKKKKKWLLVDMDAFEMNCVPEKVMLMINDDNDDSTTTHQQEEGKNVLGIEKSGGGGKNVNVEDVTTMLYVAKSRHGDVKKVLEDALLK